MTVITLIAALAAMVAILHLLRATDLAREAIAISSGSVGVMRSPLLGDEEKERRVREASIRLFRVFILISAVAVAAVAAPIAVICFGAWAGLFTIDAAIEIASGWPFIVFSTAAVVAAFVVLERGRARLKEPQP